MAYKDPLDPRNKEARRRHYYANKEQYYERNKKREEEIKAWVREVKSVPCMDCGVSYPHYVMDLHHRDPTQKLFNPSNLFKQGSWRIAREEIEKCDVLCANCHRERSYGLEGP